MIKFFRHIRLRLLTQASSDNVRQRMLKENRFSRYLLYAIGEIILVMVGILLALQVNNWNNDRANRAKEAKYLNGIRADLQIDLINLKEFMADKDIKASSSLLLLDMEDPITAAEIHRTDSIIWRVFIWRTYNPSTKTMDELVGSGNLSLIRNDSIKALMLDIEQQEKRVAGSTEHMRREYDYYLYDRSAALRTMAPFTEWEQWIERDQMVSNVRASEPELTAFRAQYHAILHDLTFRNGLKLALRNNHTMRLRCEVLHGGVEHLIALIDEELRTGQ